MKYMHHYSYAKFRTFLAPPGIIYIHMSHYNSSQNTETYQSYFSSSPPFYFSHQRYSEFWQMAQKLNKFKSSPPNMKNFRNAHFLTNMSWKQYKIMHVLSYYITPTRNRVCYAKQYDCNWPKLLQFFLNAVISDNEHTRQDMLMTQKSYVSYVINKTFVVKFGDSLRLQQTYTAYI